MKEDEDIHTAVDTTTPTSVRNPKKSRTC